MSGEHPLKERAAALPNAPGVYRFLDGEGVILYVGKAKSLRKRVASYFSGGQIPPKTRVMLVQAVGLEMTVTGSETEALLLEANLIKRHRPRYNILLKDDKSYPYLHLSTDHPFPRLALYRGDRREGGRFFGPYPSAGAVRETLRWLQRIFPVRQCRDSQFDSRQRPCLQYQIQRCSGPCCGRISGVEYAARVAEVTLFLEGRDRQLLESLKQEMWSMAEARRFEEAARLRDRMKAIALVQEKRKLNLTRGEDLDLVALVREGERCAVQVFFIRGGVNLGNRGFFPENTGEAPDAEVLGAFLEQFYAGKPPPPEVLVSHPVPEVAWLEGALAQARGGTVRVRQPQRGEKRRLLEMALDNAREALARRRREDADTGRLLEELGERLGMPATPERLEVYDVSHIQDSQPVASLIVFGRNGFQKGQYRKFIVDDPELADDTARMGAVLTRRFERLKREEGGVWPDLVLLDGGQGQLSAALAVAEELQLDGIQWCAIAKGPERNAGRERLFLPERRGALILPEGSPLLHMLQRVRDEAHRFAIGFHRTRREKAQTRSALDGIAGVGPKRKRALLRQFGSVKALREAAPEQLARVEGISLPLAERIVTTLQQGD